MAYYNTTSLAGDELKVAVEAAANQYEAVRVLYQRHPALSPSEVQAHMVKFGKKWPITSVRRAISNLAEAGVLRKTTMYVLGQHGRWEHVWQRVEPTTAKEPNHE